jgi:YD repeat-containing protein
MISRLLSFSLSHIGVMTLALHCIGCSERVQSSAEIVIQKEGNYAAPVGDASVSVVNEEHGLVNFKYQTPGNASGPAQPFDPTQPWALAWDKQGRLWSYTARDGVHCYSEASVMRPGRSGGWSGVPASFIDKLPAEMQSQYKSDLSSGKGA